MLKGIAPRFQEIVIRSSSFDLAEPAVRDFVSTWDEKHSVFCRELVGTGTALFTYDDVARTLPLNVVFSGLTGNVSAAHIHAATAVAFVGTAGVATLTPSFIGFPSGPGVTSGSYNQAFDLTLASSYNGTYLNNLANAGNTANAEASLIGAVRDGKAYLNIHTSVYPGGEIRGFFQRVPDGSSTALLLLPALLVAGFTYRRRRA